MRGLTRLVISARALGTLGSSFAMPALAADPAGPPAAPVEQEPNARRAARSAPGFDTLEHRFGFGLGLAHVSSTDITAWMARLDYTLGWQGWGLGVSLALDLSGYHREDFTLFGLGLRRNVLIGDVRAWAGAELDVVRLGLGSQGDARAVLYHGTSSAAELGLELGRTTTTRPFVSLRVDLPWYRTEGEALTLAPLDGPDSGATLIDAWQRWTPVYSVWGGLAL